MKTLSKHRGCKLSLIHHKGQSNTQQPPTNGIAVSLCKHRESDICFILHLTHANDQEHNKAYLRTLDTCVIILAAPLSLLEIIWTMACQGDILITYLNPCDFSTSWSKMEPSPTTLLHLQWDWFVSISVKHWQNVINMLTGFHYIINNLSP